ncbi:hypothetical protein [Endozoicomonas lisbonensis]|uniref:Tail fiber assembly protein n=1 Tax=Endozoicomonas lisbonensis TaxID=3120522 RepID=A0ABV2SHE8_9GAMM
MEWYRYSEKTGEYLHPVSLNKDPLNPGKYYPLENAVPDEPLPEKEGFKSVWSNGLWVYKEDHRGKTAYNKTDKSKLEIKELGSIPDTHTDQQPEEFDEWNDTKSGWIRNKKKEREHLYAVERAWAMQELVISRDCLLIDFPISKEGQAAILDYRAKLRNPQREEHPKYPDKSWRPQWPEGVKRPAT